MGHIVYGPCDLVIFYGPYDMVHTRAPRRFRAWNNDFDSAIFHMIDFAMRISASEKISNYCFDKINRYRTVTLIT